ncbi:2-phospho-L-lactate guanylyltransferase [Pengzhenrongella sicca]|uniref:Phosphoenolpyruvate guanylyltransferase n=2 Tax=Pengzhenrongella sicca TaxID=2819238 RepID=A0A8A4ZIY7_9MICO|nr:2-phospho-L-lactate guanylyltransferase [Pengzhenrongella sicca]
MAAPTSAPPWALVVPLKLATDAKSRLAGHLSPGRRLELALAMLGDTIEAAAAATGVDHLVVVTADAAMAAAATAAAGGLATDLVDEPDPPGLNAAVRAGIRAARAGRPAHAVGVLLGDLPALRPAELSAALALAARHRLALVPDAGGTGTTLLTALAGVAVAPAFGPGSARRHAAGGHVVVAVPARSGLVRDVDVPADIAAVLALGVGHRTARVLRGYTG